ncbi:MAG: low affinity iron permease family protein [Candidatus Paracaedibacteraceae bacterium]|nr:low affinity iron permease family protein [Candidatus Paracaedibacteraceae bacterium]
MSGHIADLSGRPFTFLIAIAIVVGWAITGPLFNYSDTWQLIINTGTTIITFLMVFLIQNTQNRDSEALQIKIDELIRAHAGAHNVLLDLEELSPHQLKAIKKKYEDLAKRARADLSNGKADTDTEDV